MMAMTMAFSKLFAGDLKVFSVCCDPCYCAPNWKSAQLNPRFISIRPRLAIAGHFAAGRNVGRENLGDAGIYRSRPCRARFAVVMNAAARSEERRVGEEWRTRWVPVPLKKKR